MALDTKKDTAAAGGSSTVAGLQPREYEQIRALAYDYCGIDLRTGKEELVKARLGKKLRELGLSSYRDYCDFVKQDQSGEALVSMIDALTTNHTNFFREPQHFAFLRQLLSKNRQQSGPSFKVWSAACATGEEPYSIAFTMLEGGAGGSGRPAQGSILATDISTQALKKAAAGNFREERFEGLPLETLGVHLLRGQGQSAGWFKVRPEVRALIEFRRLNLMNVPAEIGLFRVIFCRNVMIYFDQVTQEALILRLMQHLEPGGYLFIGHSESLNGMRHALEYIQPAVYRRIAGAQA
jgi:chemotaxis protein methyltransferase CheR